MFRTPYLIATSVATLLVASVPSFGQSPTPAGGRVIIVKLVVKTGAMPYVFEPANITAERGDTLRFVDEANVPHDVHFESHPAGAKLGAATVSPYLTTTGQTYDVVIDARFTDGKYKFVCDPHEMLGMRGTLTIEERTVASHSIK
ncbi:MAG: plastocyanin/azurin family copper-binding protein [Gemmatimonadaceae bacterium]